MSSPVAIKNDVCPHLGCSSALSLFDFSRKGQERSLPKHTTNLRQRALVRFPHRGTDLGMNLSRPYSIFPSLDCPYGQPQPCICIWDLVKAYKYF